MEPVIYQKKSNYRFLIIRIYDFFVKNPTGEFSLTSIINQNGVTGYNKQNVKEILQMLMYMRLIKRDMYKNVNVYKLRSD